MVRPVMIPNSNEIARNLLSKQSRIFFAILLISWYIFGLAKLSNKTKAKEDSNIEEKRNTKITQGTAHFGGNVIECESDRNVSNSVVYLGENDSKTSDTFGPKCALLFFGLPRLFRLVVFPSIERYILPFNSHCDIFIHTYNVTTISTVRSGEKNGTISPSDTYLLTNNTFIESMGSFFSQRNLSEFRPYHSQDWGKCCENVDNLIKQWHSIEGVWKLMERHGHKMKSKDPNYHATDHYYERVGLFRSDVVYLSPINISHGDAVVPEFLWPEAVAKHKEDDFVNDRMFYGKYDYAKVWATERFLFAKEYLKKPDDIQGETFLKALLTKRKVPFEKRDICFWRARAGGKVKVDCKAPNCIEKVMLEILTQLKEV